MKKGKINKIINFILAVIFLAGLSLLLYPTVSEYWNSFQQSRAIVNYNDQVAGLTDEQYQELWKMAEEYNKSLVGKSNVYMVTEEQREEYERLLDVAENGIMAYVEIPKMKCSLPIYHGTSEAVLQVAIGHLEWTSLPIGGENTHTVLSGHRGLPSAKLFTDLDKMEIGDTFNIRVLNEVLTYEVDQILVVEPQDTKDLHIVEGQDYCTLFTCTPYAVNTHRLLVRGHRIETEDVEKVEDAAIEKVDSELEEQRQLEENLRTALTVVAALTVVMIVLLIAIKISKERKRRGGDANEDK